MLSLHSTSSTAAPTVAERPAATVRAAAPAAGAAEAASTRAWPEVIVHTGIAGVVDGVSTVAITDGGGTLDSVPAALCRMRDIAVVSSSGVLTDIDRAKLRAEYGQLSQQVASLIGTSAPSAVPEAAAGGDAPAHHHGDAPRDDKPAATAGATPDTASEAAKGAAGVVTAGPTAGMPVAVQRSELTHPAALAQFRRQQAATAPRPGISIRA